MRSGKAKGTAVFLSNGLFPIPTVTVKKMIVENIQYRVVLLQHILLCTDVWMSDGQQPQLASLQISNWQMPHALLSTQDSPVGCESTFF